MLRFLDHLGFASLSSMEDILQLSPRAFEYFTKYLLEREGYSRVRVTSKKGSHNADGGVDVIAYRDGNPVYVQCKKWRKSQRGNFMPIEQVRALRAPMDIQHVSAGIFVSTLPFGITATNEARQLNIDLWGPERIQEAMKKINPRFGKQRFNIWRLWLSIPREIKRAFEPFLWLAILYLVAQIYLWVRK
ncbi:MAG: restriction endonuclease [Candidatus Peribacter sp.]|nr:restriction endonuclease [Candidatus Peribacter sp.]